MRINSRQKGARGERQWRDELRARGFTARRGQQFSGSPDSPDVVCEQLADIHFEVKCVQNLNVQKAMDQAVRDGTGKTPVVAHKKNGTDWLITMRASDWLTIIKDHHDQQAQLAIILGTDDEAPTSSSK